MSIKISQLSASVAVTGSDLVATVIDNGGSLITTKATVTQVFNYITSSITDLTLNNITVLDNTILGNSATDSLTVNATSIFNSDLTASNLSVTGELNVDGNTSVAQLTASSGFVQNDLVVGGRITAQEFYTEFISASVIYESGSTKFGDTPDDTHQFTGSVYVNSGVVSGSEARFTDITGSFSGSGANLSNIPNGALVNSSITIGSTNISLGSSSTIIDGLTQLTASSAYFSGDIFVNGTASIVHLNTVNEQSLVIGDKYITILSGAADHTSLDGSGILWGSGSTDPTTDDLGAAAHVRYVSSFDKMRIFPGLYVSGALTASSHISGTEGYFNSVTASFAGNIVGTTAQFTSLTADVTGSISGATAQFTSLTANVTGNISGNADTVTNGVYTIGDQSVSGSKDFANTITASGGITGSFAKFTSVTGTLHGNGFEITNLTASNINNFTNDVRSQFSPGANITIVDGVISSTGGGTGSASPGGPDQSLQFNSGSLLGGSSNLIYDYNNGILSGTVAKFTSISSSNFTITGNLLIYQTAALGDNAYILYNPVYDKLVVFPGLYVSGALTASSHVSGAEAYFNTVTASIVSASQYYGLPEYYDGFNIAVEGYSSSLDPTVAVIAGVAGGTNQTVQFNESGALSGSNSFIYNKNTGLLSGTYAEFTSITGSFSGSGTGLTSIPNGALSNSAITIGSTVIPLGSSATTISGINQLTSSYILVQNDILIQGTASIAQLNTLNQQSLVVGDKYITILSGAADHVSLDGSGILWGSGGVGATVNEFGANAHARYRASYDKLEIFPGLYVSGALTASLNISGTTGHFSSVTASFDGDISGSKAEFLTITGTLNGLATSVVVSTANISLGSNNHIILADATGAELTVTLPLANSTKFRQYIIKKTDDTSNKVIVSGTSGETIDGTLGREINTQYEALTIVNNGIDKWFIV